MKSMLRWMRRLALLAAAVAIVRRFVDSDNRPGRGATAAPTIGGDTWPPVPVNPDRHD
jgi:hypothetical protein